MEMVKLSALRPHRYKGKRFAVGDVYEATEHDSRILRALRNATLADSGDESLTYARRDMQAAPMKRRGRPPKIAAMPNPGPSDPTPPATPPAQPAAPPVPPHAPTPAAPMTTPPPAPTPTNTPGPPLVDEPAPTPTPPAVSE